MAIFKPDLLNLRTVPFMARYRTANTGGLDEVQVRAVRDALVEQRELARAKLKALAVVDERAPPAARAQLHRAIQAAADRETLKDILAPFGGAGKKSLAALTAEFIQSEPKA